MEIPGISPVLKISKVVKFARTTNQSLMLMATLALHTMSPTQMVVETMTLKNSSLPENAVSVEAEVPETTALETSHGTCISPMMMLMDMPWSGLKIQNSTPSMFGTSQVLFAP